jgi:hypothetical protein
VVRVLPDPPLTGAIAQLGEHLLCKQGVVGSIPTGSTRLDCDKDGCEGAHEILKAAGIEAGTVFFDNQ